MAYAAAALGGKKAGASLASPASQKADLRRPITAWKALTWAYADEIVLAASSLGPSRIVADGPAMSGLGREKIGGGAINGWYEPHQDARTIHAKLADWFSHDLNGQQLVMWHAERRRQMPAEIHLPRVKAVPVYDRQGNVLIQRRRAHRHDRVASAYCMVEFEGLNHALADSKERAWRDFYGMFLAFLDVMELFQLSKWKISGRGLTDVGESLTR